MWKKSPSFVQQNSHSLWKRALKNKTDQYSNTKMDAISQVGKNAVKINQNAGLKILNI